MITNVDKMLASDTERKDETITAMIQTNMQWRKSLYVLLPMVFSTGSIYSIKDIHTSYMEGLKDNNVIEFANRKND